MLSVAAGGWAVAALAAVPALAARRELARRSEAVARACHELRGPLTAAQLGLSPAGPAHELTAGDLRAVDAELRRATTLLQDLADVGRRPLTAVRPGHLDRIELAELLTGAAAAAAGRARAAGSSVEARWDGPGAVVWGDPGRLTQAIGNLVANALEHGRGPVRLRGSVRDGHARVEVDDDGPGLAAPVAELVRRRRAGRGDRGRGLAIASEIASAHGGTVAAAPVGRGGRVVLSLPLGASQ